MINDRKPSRNCGQRILAETKPRHNLYLREYKPTLLIIIKNLNYNHIFFTQCYGIYQISRINVRWCQYMNKCAVKPHHWSAIALNDHLWYRRKTVVTPDLSFMVMCRRFWFDIGKGDPCTKANLIEIFQPYPTIPEVHLAIFLVDFNLKHILVCITQHDIVINVQIIFLSKTRW